MYRNSFKTFTEQCKYYLSVCLKKQAFIRVDDHQWWAAYFSPFLSFVDLLVDQVCDVVWSIVYGTCECFYILQIKSFLMHQVIFFSYHISK